MRAIYHFLCLIVWYIFGWPTKYSNEWQYRNWDTLD